MAIPKNNDYIAKISLINPKMAVETGGSKTSTQLF